MSEVVHFLAAGLWLQELYRPLLQILQQNYVVFTYLIIHFALQVVFRL